MSRLTTLVGAFSIVSTANSLIPGDLRLRADGIVHPMTNVTCWSTPTGFEDLDIII